MAQRIDPVAVTASAAPDRLRSPADAFALFGAMLAAASVERVAAAYLSGERVLAAIEVAAGDSLAAVLPTAAILREAILRGADTVLLAHNHPAGDPAPSLEDLRATRRLAEAAAALGIRLLDHIVVARDGCRSFRMMGLL